MQKGRIEKQAVQEEEEAVQEAVQEEVPFPAVSQQYERHTHLCDRGRVYGSCPTTTARFLRVAVIYAHANCMGGTRDRGGRGGIAVTASDAELINARDIRSVEITRLYGTLVENLSW